VCGRYVISAKLEKLLKELELDVSDSDLDDFQPNYNVGPGSFAPVLTKKAKTPLRMQMFGFTPSWSEKRMYLFNARAEGNHNKENNIHFTGAMGIIQKPSFRSAIRKNRCLIPANGFYEGPQKEKLSKPYYIEHQNKDLMFFAGVSNDWVDKETGEVTETFAIITTVSNKTTQKIGHHRSPVILEKSKWSAWMDSNTELSEVTSMLRPYTGALRAYPVSTDVKKISNNHEGLIKPLAQPIEKEYTYGLQHKIQLEGMGMTTSRKRKNEENKE
jgi:putative SOS response-associated peptidase YedK